MDWITYNRALFFTVLEAGKSKVGASAGLVSDESPLSGSIDGHLLTMSSYGLRGEGVLWDLFYKGMGSLIPFMKSTPFWPNHLPNVLLPNIITLGIRFQPLNLRGHIECIAKILPIVKELSRGPEEVTDIHSQIPKPTKGLVNTNWIRLEGSYPHIVGRLRGGRLVATHCQQVQGNEWTTTQCLDPSQPNKGKSS